MTRTPHNARSVVVSVNTPVLLRRSDDEIWPLNPRRRYVLNADILQDVMQFVETMSDLEGAAHYNPLRTAPKVRLAKSHILVERYRDRGMGDLLFTTGPLQYLHHLAGAELNVHYYAYADRGQVLSHCPWISHGAPLVGPVLYDELPNYDYHWVIDGVTEHDEEPDQGNVYDTLFKSIGIDPATVPAKYKRPTALITPAEAKQLDDFFHWTFLTTKSHLDLRKTGYYVVAPFANSALRCAPYSMMLQLICELAKPSGRPVLVVGNMWDRIPGTDMSAGDFNGALDEQSNLTSGRILNLIGKTKVRNLVEVISGANCVVSLDSAPLYISQGLRVPCVSIWGSHDPAARIGYDPDYMKLAVWQRQACRFSPCYAWSGFPESKCPQGSAQRICNCYLALSPDDVLQRVEEVERSAPKLIVPSSSPQ